MLRKENATEWRFDLSDVLLFTHLPIRTVQYSIEIEEGFARHASRPPVRMVVRVVTDEPVTATVTITVDQSQHSESFAQNITCPCPWSKDCRCF